MTRGGLPYPPRGLRGPKVGVSNSGVGPLGDPGSPLGPSRVPPGPSQAHSEGTLGPQRPPEKTLTSHFALPTSDLSPLGCILHALAKSPLQKCYKNQAYFNDFENAVFVSISVFYIPRGPKGSSETPFGERFGDFGVPRPPLEIGKRPPWAPWAAPRAPFRLPHIDP